MKRDRIDFDTFTTNFIKNPDGFFPVNSAFKEDYDGNHLRVLKMDMICEWRLDDGKILFIEVPFETGEQLVALLGYLRTTANMLHNAIIERVDDLPCFIDTRPESDAVPFPPSDIPTLSDEVMKEIRRRTVAFELSLIREALLQQGN